MRIYLYPQYAQKKSFAVHAMTYYNMGMWLLKREAKRCIYTKKAQTHHIPVQAYHSLKLIMEKSAQHSAHSNMSLVLLVKISLFEVVVRTGN